MESDLDDDDTTNQHDAAELIQILLAQGQTTKAHGAVEAAAESSAGKVEPDGKAPVRNVSDKLSLQSHKETADSPLGKGAVPSAAHQDVSPLPASTAAATKSIAAATTAAPVGGEDATDVVRLQRISNITPTLRTVPGAVRVQGAGGNPAASETTDDVSEGTDSNPTKISSAVGSSAVGDAEDLAVAKPVEHQSDDLEDARPVEAPAEEGKHMQEWKMIGYGILSFLAVVCIVVIVVVFVVVAPNNTNKADSSEEGTSSSNNFTNNTNVNDDINATMTPQNKLKMLLPDYTIPLVEYMDTPQAMAFEWVLLDPNFEFYSDHRLQRRFALATFWYSTNGQEWGPNWLDVERHECNWEHFMPANDKWYMGLVKRYSKYKYIDGPCVPVDPDIVDMLPLMTLDFQEKNRTFVNATASLVHEEYLYLAMERQQLGGELPRELAMLTSLKMIQLDQTTLQGSIPTILAELTTLEDLHLYKSTLTGSIPTVLAKLTELRTLIIAGNKNEQDIRGTLPSELALLSKLITFNIFETSCTGTIPVEYMSLRPYEMQLYYNELTGTVPTEIGLLSNLDWLGMEMNHLTGTLPTELGNLQNLWLFYLYSDRISGTIPTEFGLFMGRIEQLYLTDNELTGTIPTELAPKGNNIWRLRIESNFLTGTVPTELGLLTACSSLSISSNMLTGTIPSEVAAIGPMEYFRGFANQLTGTLPSEFFVHPNMSFFWMEDNRFSGTLPASIGLWTKVRELRLQNNTFIGELPSEIGSLQALEVLNVALNYWTGTIPTEFGLLAMNTSSLTLMNLTYTDDLSGGVPDELCAWQRKTDAGNILDFDCGPVCGCGCICINTNATAGNETLSNSSLVLFENATVAVVQSKVGSL